LTIATNSACNMSRCWAQTFVRHTHGCKEPSDGAQTPREAHYRGTCRVPRKCAPRQCSHRLIADLSITARNGPLTHLPLGVVTVIHICTICRQCGLLPIIFGHLYEYISYRNVKVTLDTAAVPATSYSMTESVNCSTYR